MFTSHQPPKKRIALFRKLSKMTLLIGIGILCSNPMNALAQEKPKKSPIMRSVQYNLPSGYQQVGTTELFYYQNSNSIDFIGRYNSRYYSSTYSDGGYKVAMQVNDNGAFSVDCLNGTTSNGVSFNASIEAQGELARVCYSVHNSNDYDVTVSLGTHADVMIGSNDSAPIEQRRDQLGNPYGLTMKDGNGAQLCVLYGAGLAGVSKVDDYWFGYYYTNRDPYQMVGNYSPQENYMQENGYYDSGMGWCWKNRTIPAGETVVFSYLIGVGEVNLEPNSSFEVTPDDPEGWNDLSRPHRLTLNGTYESPAGIDGFIEYSVEDNDTWNVLTDTLASGEEFTASLVAMFKPEREAHTINFRTVDAVGNTTLLTPIIYNDVYYHEVSGIESKTYNYGDSIFQTNLVCDLDESQYVANDYHNNVNAGTATFKVQGVFPMTIGSRTYSFEITPLSLEGNIEFVDSLSYSYTGNPFTPKWRFTNDLQNNLIANKDYNIKWKDNVYPGSAILQVHGVNNFIGTLQNTFIIDKAQLREDLYSLQLPSEDITFDNASHPASYTKAEGVGDITFYYSHSSIEELSTVAPINIGKYDIYAEIADGWLYYGTPIEKVGTFTIYQFDESDWNVIQSIYPNLIARGWDSPWDLSGGISDASYLSGLIIERGKVVGVDLSNAALNGQFPLELLSFPNLNYLNISGNNFDGAIESVVAFAQQDLINNKSLTELNIADNSFSGNLGIFSVCFPSLISINASGNRLSDIYPIISEKVTTLNISNQTIDKVVEYNLSNSSIEELVQQIPTILLYCHNEQNYTKTLRLKCTMDDGFGMTISYDSNQIVISDVSEQNAYHGNSGDIIDVWTVEENPSETSSTFKIKLLFENGDANFVNGLEVTDLQSTILYAFNDYPTFLPFNFTAADTYQDHSINVQDVVSTVNLLLNESIVNKSSIAKIKSDEYDNGYSDGSYEYANKIWVENGRIMVETEMPIAAMSIDMSSSAEFTFSNHNMIVSSNEKRSIIYSLNGGYIPTGLSEIGTCNPDAKIISVAASSINAQPVEVCVNKNGTSSIDEILPDMDMRYEIYTPDGIRISKPRKGINIIKHLDNQISKIYIR